ncbi:TPA: response regulator transcription factor [Yersinia enterocolitica]|nr:response regulator transcription factor [Yersinia enterocolitica]HDL6985310.1 response regulator transcription factor [Yersinia enterocolitica]HDL7067852.1 response regulator transcription factor [Yersinia enterocolitica]HDL7072242.1 response regulator transcription factor [Yersinia enterocolitica]
MIKLKVIVTDQHPLMVKGILEFIQCHSELYIEASGYTDLSQAVRQCNEQNADIFILGDFSNFLCGVELVHWVNSKNVTGKIISYIESMSTMDIDSFISAGAKGGVWKNSHPATLNRAIDAVINNFYYFDNPFIENKKLEERCVPQPQLTTREKQVLQLIADGMTNKEMARQLIISNKTIESHRLNLMKKLNVHNGIELLKTALRMGVCTI